MREIALSISCTSSALHCWVAGCGGNTCFEHVLITVRICKSIRTHARRLNTLFRFTGTGRDSSLLSIRDTMSTFSSTIFWLMVLLGTALIPCKAADPSTLQLCTSDSECSGSQRCVKHYNYATSGNCESYDYCIDASENSCSCSSGYTCRVKDCPASPYECLILEDTTNRCGGQNAPVCKDDESCTYIYQNLSCFKCPCYGTHNVTCIKASDQYPACGPNSIAEIRGDQYTCDGCKSASAVLANWDVLM
ncbi:uncharacterized protein LOC144148651 [Haemaphysalis longicornis]